MKKNSDVALCALNAAQTAVHAIAAPATLLRHQPAHCCSWLLSRLLHVTRCMLFSKTLPRSGHHRPFLRTVGANLLLHFHKRPGIFYPNLLGKMPRPRTAAHTLCEPAQSICASKFHKSHFTRKFTGKMPRTSWSTLIKHQPLQLP